MGHMAQDIGLEPMTYGLEDRCSSPTELILHMLDGCFAVSKHYHRLLGGFCAKKCSALHLASNAN